ncbi:nuclear transport factor 2 family protein [Mycolicibacterium thermoresistibile]
MNSEDALEIQMLLADYGHVVDDHDWDRADEVFAEDFVFDMSGVGRPDLHGIADIVENFKGRNMYAHVTTNTTMRRQDDDTVSAHSKFIGFPNEGPPVTGDYYDQIVRTPAGWRLKHRSAEIRQRKFFD